MNDHDFKKMPKFEEQWREWTEVDSEVDEQRLKGELLVRLPDRRVRPRARFVLAAAAASLLAVIIGLQANRPTRPPASDGSPEVVHETGGNVVLILREGKEPIYVVTDSTTTTNGEKL